MMVIISILTLGTHRYPHGIWLNSLELTLLSGYGMLAVTIKTRKTNR